MPFTTLLTDKAVISNTVPSSSRCPVLFDRPGQSSSSKDRQPMSAVSRRTPDVVDGVGRVCNQSTELLDDGRREASGPLPEVAGAQLFREEVLSLSGPPRR